jgi:hypothetical protein
MPSSHLRRLPILLIAIAILALPTPTLAADPPLGEAVSLPDGTELPPMPAEQIARTAQ